MTTSSSNRKIILIGAGNVGWHLGTALFKAGFTIVQVYSPTKKSADALAKKLKAQSVTDVKKIDTSASLYIIAIKDDAIEGFTKKLTLKDKMVVHTSGSIGMAVLQPLSKNYGVFYPLQTFSKAKAVDFTAIPICIEASNKTTLDELKKIAKKISKNVQQIDSNQRRILHVGAVFACNFTNHFYAIAAALLNEHRLSFELLKPLIMETAHKIEQNEPGNVQTGPAVRGDKKTMAAHLAVLKNDKDLTSIYKLLSNHIKNKK